MIPELGNFALMLALALAILQFFIPLIGSYQKNQSMMRMARPLALGQVVFVCFSFVCLTYSFIVNDFSVLYVAQNSNTDLPFIYHIAGVWSAHEGSMLLWVTILSLWTAAVCFFSKQLPEQFISRVISILGIISVGFLMFVIFTSNPFLRLLGSVPANGQDLNPLLQDPGLASHPPILYMGYVGFSVAFAFAIAALLSGKLDKQWAKWTRPWTTVAWSFLTLGIVLGSWWSYRELGWGGWWAWDPVENASFMPWLTGTALIHCLLVTSKRDCFKGWTALLAITTFSLSLLGTFLVRSGVLSSIHAFAVDPSRGMYMLGFLAVILICSLLLYAIRTHRIVEHTEFSLFSRESFMLANNILLMVLMATVLLGTLYPLFVDAMNAGKISVGPPYFNAVFIPLFSILAVFMGVGPLTKWHQSSFRKTLKTSIFMLVIALIIAIGISFIVSKDFNPGVVLGLSLAFWVIASSILAMVRRSTVKGTPLKYYGMSIAHIGVAVCIIGVVISSIYPRQSEISLQPGNSTTLGNYRFELIDSNDVKGPNYDAGVANINLYKSDKLLTTMHPSKRVYNTSQMAMSVAAIYRHGLTDVYIALGEPRADGSWTMRLYVKPFITWIWLGGILMLIGGLVALMRPRKKQTQVANENATQVKS